MITPEQWYAWWPECPAGQDGLCECDYCRADDDSFYSEYLFDDRRALMWETYQRNHPNGQPLADMGG
jgi:hypothetical protein